MNVFELIFRKKNLIKGSNKKVDINIIIKLIIYIYFFDFFLLFYICFGILLAGISTNPTNTFFLK